MLLPDGLCRPHVLRGRAELIFGGVDSEVCRAIAMDHPLDFGGRHGNFLLADAEEAADADDDRGHTTGIVDKNVIHVSNALTAHVVNAATHEVASVPCTFHLFRWRSGGARSRLCRG